MAKKRSSSASGRRRVVFEVRAPVGSEVFLAGSFNGWQAGKKAMVDSDCCGIYRCTCMLPPGRHEYKFVVDGIWSVDEDNPNFACNAMGTLNSVVEVP